MQFFHLAMFSVLVKKLGYLQDTATLESFVGHVFTQTLYLSTWANTLATPLVLTFVEELVVTFPEAALEAAVAALLAREAADLSPSIEGAGK